MKKTSMDETSTAGSMDDAVAAPPAYAAAEASSVTSTPPGRPRPAPLSALTAERDAGIGGDAAGAVGAASPFSGTERILAFSDGVFAIAITLLILNVVVPKAPFPPGGLLAALRHEWPAYLSYALSFLLIGIVWANHHQIFTQIKHANHLFLLINVLFLMWVAALPFPTALLAQYLTSHNQTERHAVTAIYSGAWLLGALLFNLLWWYGVANGRLLDAGTHHGIVRRTTWSYYVGPISYLIAFALAFVSVEASLALSFALAIFYAVLPLFPAAGGVNSDAMDAP